jgi:sodium-dependent dicarboxylate transporter 2/3/5
MAEPIDTASTESEAGSGRAARIGRFAGPAVAAGLVASTHPGWGAAGGLGSDASWVLGLLAWMAIWWMTHAAELAVTSLLPVVLLPALGVMPFKDVAGNYADQVIFLFAGGTTIAWALERHGISERFVGALLRAAGRSPATVVAALFVAAVCVSAFVSNMAVTAMMLPLALGVAAGAAGAPGASAEAAARGRRNLTAASLLAVAYGSSIGGGATLVGSPPNPIAAENLAKAGQPIDFLGWMRVGVPMAVAMTAVAIPVLWWMLPCDGVVLRGARAAPEEVRARRPWTPAATMTLAVFAATVAAWTTGTYWPDWMRPRDLPDGGVAIAAALVLMLLPALDGSAARVVPWRAARELPWGVFILFGGGLALADAMQDTGLSQAIGRGFEGLGGVTPVVALAVVAAALVFASEVGSNTALTATAVPILVAAAPTTGLPLQQLVLAATFGASYAFMLPVGTPPNALVYATGRIPHGTMMRVGFVLNLAAIVVVTTIAWLLA